MSQNKQAISMEEILPIKLDIIPLYHRPIFPGVFAPMLIADERSMNTV